MSTETTFGSGAVQLRVMYPDTDVFVDILLPAPNRRVPRVKPIVQTIEGDAGQVVNKRVGYRVSFRLEYEIDLSQENGTSEWLKIKQAFNAQGELRLIPYTDQSFQEFSVFLTEESELTGLTPSKSQYGLCTLVYESVIPVQSWKTIDDWTIVRSGAVFTVSGDTWYLFNNATRESASSPCIQVL